MTDKKMNLPLLLLIGAIVVALLVLMLFWIIGSKGDDRELTDQVWAGREYLASLERKDPEAVKQIRKELFQEQVQQQLENTTDPLIEQLMSGETDPFTLFKDYAILGDSRAVGFWYWGFLEKSRCLSDGGHTIRMIPEWYDELEEMNPSYIFLCYGLNDCSIGYWDNGEEYAAEYVEYVKELQERLPDCTIVVSSILPAQDPAFDRSKRWRDIPEWNVVLKAACVENGILYADCDRLYEEYPKLWDPDGIHFREAFYPYWSSLLIATALVGGQSDAG